MDVQPAVVQNVLTIAEVVHLHVEMDVEMVVQVDATIIVMVAVVVNAALHVRVLVPEIAIVYALAIVKVMQRAMIHLVQVVVHQAVVLYVIFQHLVRVMQYKMVKI